MIYLYLDNFRGFSKASVPLLDVNFLVGENSSGKTSLLMVLKMLSSNRLLMGSDSLMDEGPAESFNELVSAHAADRTYFRLGYAGERRRAKGAIAGRGMLVKFVREGSLPKVAELTYTAEDKEISLKFEGDRTFYKIHNVPVADSAQEMKNRLTRWADGNLGGAEWKEISPAMAGGTNLPLFFILALVNHLGNKSDASKKTKDRVDLNFGGLPMLSAPVWIAPIRATPRRTYDAPQTTYSSEGDHTPYVIRRMLNSDSEAVKFKEFIERVGKASGLFEKIEIKQFGDDSSGPFEVDALLDDKAMNVGWLGYGVSQSLPIFVELLDRPPGSSFAIQQPEVHLHPRAQASLGDVFFEMALTDGKRFIIETHSDFAIDRFRMNYRRKRSKSDRDRVPKGQILFFERSESKNTVTPIIIGSRGELPSDQPKGYRKFFIKEEMQLLGL